MGFEPMTFRLQSECTNQLCNRSIQKMREQTYYLLIANTQHKKIFIRHQIQTLTPSPNLSHTHNK